MFIQSEECAATVRILHIVNIGFEAGGAEKCVRLLKDCQLARGHEVRVIAVETEADGHELFADFLVPAVSGGPVRKFFGFLWHRAAYTGVKRVVEEFRPDVVHLHTIGGFGPAVFPATRGVATVATVHGAEDWTLRLLRSKLVGPGERLGAVGLARYLHLRLVVRPAYRLGLRRLDGFVAPSRYIADTVRCDVGRVPIEVIPHAVERMFTPGPVSDLWHVLFVGRVEPVKGVDVLIAAFRILLATHPRARLTIVGDGDARAGLEAAAADLVAAGVVGFRGWLSPDEVAESIRDAAVVAVPSTGPEIFGLVALEAIQRGRPVIASRSGGLGELVGPDNGLLVTPGDPDELAAALASMLGDAVLLERLGNGSTARAAAFDLDRCLDAHEDLYRRVSSER